MKPNKEYSFAVIFDMDGVVVDNAKYHILAWQKFARDLGLEVSGKTVKEKFLGKLGREIIRDIGPKNISLKSIAQLDAKRENYYRKIYSKAIKPVRGLPQLLKQLKKERIQVAMATSAPPENVRFIFKHTGLKKYFKLVIDAKGVKKGKPNPAIFLKAAKKLGTATKNCVVFEDAMQGIKAAKAARMKVVGVATSHSASELRHTDFVIKDFRRLTVDKLAK